MNGEFWARIEERAAEADDRRPGTCFSGFNGLGRQECESPIERVLAAALAEPAEKFGYEIIPQYKLDRYRFDFAIKSKRTDTVLAVVECDGAAFHSSPDQLANDSAKSRAARAENLRVFRLTGTQILRDPSRYANEILFRLWPR